MWLRLMRGWVKVVRFLVGGGREIPRVVMYILYGTENIGPSSPPVQLATGGLIISQFSIEVEA